VILESACSQLTLDLVYLFGMMPVSDRETADECPGLG
jgi:hypothetical protein